MPKLLLCSVSKSAFKSNKMKTAMQELIKELEQKREMWKANGTTTERRIRGAYVDAIVMAKELILQEKEQLKNTFKAAMENGLGDSEYYENESNEYYKDTFGDKVE